MRSVLAGLFLAAIALAASGCDRFSSDTYRYRMTVEVDTPSGPRSGSSVIEVRTSGGSGIPDSSLRTRVRGEAVAVDLANGATLFALLRTPDDVDGAAGFAPAAYRAVLPDLRKPGSGDWSEVLQTLKRQRQPAILPASYYPMLVRFRDIRDPRTLEGVDHDDLPEAFGPGVRLRRINLQITDDAVTTGIESRLPWWDTYRDRHFDGTSNSLEDMTTRSLLAHLSSGSFSTEIGK